MKRNIKVIITGATGMVGEGIAHVALNHPNVEKVLIIGRKPSGISHSKLQEINVADLMNLSSIEEEMKGYDATFFCLGISSIGINKEDYYKTTYDLTLNFAKIASRQNPEMVFEYISGAGTDATEKGNISWARVKGKTENDLMKLAFKKVICLRPGFIKPIKGLKRTHKFYKFINWFFPIGRFFYPSGFCTMQELGNAMINAVYSDFNRKVLEGKDILELSKK